MSSMSGQEERRKFSRANSAVTDTGRHLGGLNLNELNKPKFGRTITEGDVPALLSMCVAMKKFGTPGFQANLSRIDGDKLLFAL